MGRPFLPNTATEPNRVTVSSTKAPAQHGLVPILLSMLSPRRRNHHRGNTIQSFVVVFKFRVEKDYHRVRVPLVTDKRLAPSEGQPGGTDFQSVNLRLPRSPETTHSRGGVVWQWPQVGSTRLDEAGIPGHFSGRFVTTIYVRNRDPRNQPEHPIRVSTAGALRGGGWASLGIRLVAGY